MESFENRTPTVDVTIDESGHVRWRDAFIGIICDEHGTYDGMSIAFELLILVAVVSILNEEKYSVEEISKRFGVSSSTAIKIRKFVLDATEYCCYLAGSSELDTLRFKLSRLRNEFRAALKPGKQIHFTARAKEISHGYILA